MKSFCVNSGKLPPKTWVDKFYIMVGSKKIPYRPILNPRIYNFYLHCSYPKK